MQRRSACSEVLLSSNITILQRSDYSRIYKGEDQMPIHSAVIFFFFSFQTEPHGEQQNPFNVSLKLDRQSVMNRDL